MKVFNCTDNVLLHLRLVQSLQGESTAGEMDGYCCFVPSMRFWT